MLISDMELIQALDNLRNAQERLNCWPQCLVGVDRYDESGAGLEFQFWMGKSGDGVDNDNYLQCSMPDSQLRDILDRKIHWNNLEIGCLIEFDRTGPYMPDAHTLLSFFHLPRP